MYAIVEVAGKQFKVRQDDTLFVPLLQDDIDSQIVLDRVLLVAGDDGAKVGAPTLDGASVTATVVDHVKANKVLVFKKKRRKRYRVKRGHRQQYTKIKINELSV